MTVADLAGLGGLGFVLIAVLVNIVHVRGRLPLPASGRSLAETTEDYASVGAALRTPSVLAPLSWLCLTVFAAGAVTAAWHGSSDAGTSVARTWALVGFGGVLLQNGTFAVVEALRFALAEAATRARDTVAGLWALSTVLFGFNQVFLATALLGFTVAGSAHGLLPVWHVVLGCASAALLLVSSSAAPFTTDGAHRLSVLGLVGWLGWIVWIAVHSMYLLGI